MRWYRASFQRSSLMSTIFFAISTLLIVTDVLLPANTACTHTHAMSAFVADRNPSATLCVEHRTGQSSH